MAQPVRMAGLYSNTCTDDDVITVLKLWGCTFN